MWTVQYNHSIFDHTTVQKHKVFLNVYCIIQSEYVWMCTKQYNQSNFECELYSIIRVFLTHYCTIQSEYFWMCTVIKYCNVFKKTVVKKL